METVTEERPPPRCSTRSNFGLEHGLSGRVNFPEISISSYVKVIGTLPEMEQTSMCLWVRIPEPIDGHIYTFLSYATDESSNMLCVEYVYEGNGAYNVLLTIKNWKNRSRQIPSSLLWTFWCFTWTLGLSGEYWLYSNGHKINNEEDTTKGDNPMKIEGGGVLILGQDQDEVEGKFNVKQAFQGDMTEFNLWNRFISQQEIQLLMMSTCGIGDRDVIVSWQWSTFQLFHVSEQEHLHFDHKYFKNAALYKKNVRVHGHVEEGNSPPDVLVDGDRRTCISISNQSWTVQIDLGAIYAIRNLTVILKTDMDEPTDFDMDVSLLHQGSKRSCGEISFVSIEEYTYLVFSCVDDNGDDRFGRHVVVRVQNQKLIPLCDILVCAELEGDCKQYISVENTTLPGIASGRAWWHLHRISIGNPSVLCDQTPGSHFPMGKSKVNCWPEYSSVDKYRCSFIVTIKDVESPTITSPCSSKEVQLPHYMTPCVNVSWEEPTANDNSGTVFRTRTAAPGDCFPLRTTEVTYTFRDSSENTVSCSVDITVIDVDSPNITSPCCSREVKQPHFATTCVNIFWEEPTADDNSGTLFRNRTAAPGDCFPQGATEVTYIFTDSSANNVSCSFNITVIGACRVQLRGFHSVWTGSIVHDDIFSVFCRPGFKPDRSPFLRCIDGKLNGTLPVCVDLDECVENKHDCDVTNGTEYCVNAIGNFSCLCVPHYRRFNGKCQPDLPEDTMVDDTKCAIGKSDSFCPQQVDDFGILWPATKAACTTDWQRCPNGTRGLIRRECDKLGYWLAVESAYCQSEVLAEVLHGARNISLFTDASKLIGTTFIYLSSKNVTFGGDLLMAADILHKLEERNPMLMNGTKEQKIMYIKAYIEVANVLLAADKASPWQNIHQTLGVHEGPVKVFENLQMFADHMNSLMQTEDLDVYLKYQNLEYQAFHTKTTDLMMESLVVNGHHGRSRRNTEESSEMLTTKLTFTSGKQWKSDGVTVVEAFVYHNPVGLMLPINMKKGMNKQIGISVKRKEQAVNSPVVMVRAYSGNNVNLKRGSLVLDIPHRQDLELQRMLACQSKVDQIFHFLFVFSANNSSTGHDDWRKTIGLYTIRLTFSHTAC
ncbi:uncharacterized protein [Ptychodera flava]|uniref:uncharacterized protein n=1 Tax=Ptychodera flava TaxID=63121 RepID=UPI00396A0987